MMVLSGHYMLQHTTQYEFYYFLRISLFLYYNLINHVDVIINRSGHIICVDLSYNSFLLFCCLKYYPYICDNN